MAQQKQYSLYPGAYAPIPLPSVAVPTPIPASRLYDDLGTDVGFLAALGEGGGGDGIGADGAATGTSTGASGIGVSADTASSIGSAIGGVVGGPVGSVAGSAVGAAAGVGAQGNQGAAAGIGAGQAALGLGLAAMGVPGLAIAAINSLVDMDDIAYGLGIDANTTPGFGFGDIGSGIGIGSAEGVGVGMGNDGSAPGMGDATGGGIGGAGMGIGSDGSVGGVGPSGAPGMGDSSGTGVSGSVGSGSVGSGDGAGSSKIICTAMNAAYGFGSFRQVIWLQYSAKHLTPAHERGYHFIFLPLVAAAFHKKPSFYSARLRKALEWIGKNRTADLRAEMQGKRPRPFIRILRKTSEHLLYAIGSVLLWKDSLNAKH